MKERRKGFIAGVVASAVFVGLIGTAAATIGSRTITADYNNIKISVNGSPIVPTDATGKLVEPFAVGGTTYLPVRAIGEALGADVEWDEKTNTVTLYDAQETNDLYYIKKLGLYKILSEGYADLETQLDGILNGSAEIVINTVLKEGPYAGMTFANAAQKKLSEMKETVDSHYDGCFSIMSENDILLVSNYTILNGNVASFFKSLSIGSGKPEEKDVMQAYYDAMAYKMNADILFWQVYQEAFN